jgi:hypothetical protein
MRLARLNPGYVVMAATQSLSKGVHDGKTLILNALAGSTITLPPASGSGCRLRFISTVAPTSGSIIIKVQNSIDVMIGGVCISIAAGGALSNFPTAPTSDTITMNRTTTGAAANGEWLEFEDVLAGFWFVDAQLKGTAAPATPFTAGV